MQSPPPFPKKVKAFVNKCPRVKETKATATKMRYKLRLEVKFKNLLRF